MNVAAALKCVFVFWLTNTLDLCADQTFNRPIVVAALTGLFLGDFTTGIKMAAALESIFMGISAIGGVVPADSKTSSILAVAFTILTGTDAEEGLALAMPIGTLMSSFNSLFTPLWASLAPFWEKLALEMKPKKFASILFPFACFVSPAINMTVLFIAVAFGVEGLQNVLATLPGWLRSGLAASSKMMTGIGFAITTAMIWTNETGIYFFVGYVMAAYLRLGNLPIAIFAGAIAFVTFFRDKQMNDMKTELTGKVDGSVANSEEDFF